MKLYHYKSHLGGQPINATPNVLAGPWYFYSQDISGNYDTSHVDVDACRRGANHIRLNNRTGPLCLDIEAFKFQAGSWEQAEREFRKALKIYRELPNRIGFYRFMPRRDYWTPVRLEQRPDRQKYHDRYAAWEAHNRRFFERRDDNLEIVGANGLCTQVDIIFPSCYQFYLGGLENHLTYVRAQIEQARIYRKPIIPFLWSQIHNSNPRHGLEYVGDESIGETLKLLKELQVEGVTFLDWNMDVPESFYKVIESFWPGTIEELVIE